MTGIRSIIKLASSHTLCACNEAFIYLFIWFSVVIFLSSHFLDYDTKPQEKKLALELSFNDVISIYFFILVLSTK